MLHDLIFLRFMFVVVRFMSIVQVNLNGIIAEVDVETAALLTHDAVFRKNYEAAIRAYCLSGLVEVENPVWISKKSTPRDLDATSHFLDLRKKLSIEFDDKKYFKNALWQRIATNLNENNFFVGHGMEGAEKCRKKFANLQASYMKYKDSKRQTGEGHIVKPLFFDEMEEILGKKDKVTPQIITHVEDNEVKPTPSTSKNIHETTKKLGEISSNKSGNKLQNIKKSVKSDKNKNISELIDLQKKDIEQRKSEFDRVMNYLETISLQRHNQVMALLKSRGKSRKRKRNQSESSDSD